jgi:hypothetical protein
MSILIPPTKPDGTQGTGTLIAVSNSSDLNKIYCDFITDQPIPL